MPADLLLYAIVAAGLVFWLRSVLGTRHGDEPQRPNPFTSSSETEASPPSALPEKEVLGLGLDVRHDDQSLPRNVTIQENAKKGLNDLQNADRHFEIAHFAQGAEKAFILIVESFAKGDRETLKDLLSDSVFLAFDQVIEQREKNGESVETEIHAVRKIELLDCALHDRQAYITVQFTADETCIIRDKDQNVIAGDPERITEMCDIWVFSRDIKSRDPVWQLVETRDGEPEDHKTPLPDAS